MIATPAKPVEPGGAPAVPLIDIITRLGRKPALRAKILGEAKRG